jgi:glycosyltransferase involved in cell wall biosynthesis
MARNSLVITSLAPDSSSGLPKYVGDALQPFAVVTHAWPSQSKWRRLGLMALTFHPSRQVWRDRFERETEHRLWTWYDYSRQLQTDERVLRTEQIVQVGLHFNSFPDNYRGRCYLYLHGTLSMLLDSHFDCRMWLPPQREIDQWMDAERQVVNRADRIFIGSQFLAGILKSVYGVPESKIVFAGTGCPPLKVAFAERPDGRLARKLLFVGKDFERKGGLILLEAFRKVAAAVADAELIIVGPNKMPTVLPERVRFLGRVNDRAVMKSLYEEADAFVLPTLHDSFGFVFLEAMHAGLPCVGTRIFAIPEIIEHGRTGLVVDAGDPGQLADALIQLLIDTPRASEMGRLGRLVVGERFSWHQAGTRMAMACGLFEP